MLLDCFLSTRNDMHTLTQLNAVSQRSLHLQVSLHYKNFIA